MQQERSVEKRKYLCTTIVWGTLASYLFEQRRDGFWKDLSPGTCQTSRGTSRGRTATSQSLPSTSPQPPLSWQVQSPSCRTYPDIKMSANFKTNIFKPEVRWSHLLTCCILLFVAHSEHWSSPDPSQAWDKTRSKCSKRELGNYRSWSSWAWSSFPWIL